MSRLTIRASCHCGSDFEIDIEDDSIAYRLPPAVAAVEAWLESHRHSRGHASKVQLHELASQLRDQEGDTE